VRSRGRQADLRQPFHDIAEPVDLLEGGVDAGGDPDPLELGVLDRRHDDAVAVPQDLAQLAGVDAVDLDEPQTAGKLGPQAGVQANLRLCGEATRPAVAQVAQPKARAIAARTVSRSGSSTSHMFRTGARLENSR